MRIITIKEKRFLIVWISVLLGPLTVFSQIQIGKQYPWGMPKSQLENVVKNKGCFLHEIEDTSFEDYITCTEQENEIGFSTQYFFSYDTLVRIGYIICYTASTQNLALQTYDSLINEYELLWNNKAYRNNNWLNDYYESSPEEHYLAVLSGQYRPSTLIENDKDQISFNLSGSKYDLIGEVGEFIYLIVEIRPLNTAILRIPQSKRTKN